MRNLKLEAINLIAYLVGCKPEFVKEISKEDACDLIRVDESACYSEDHRISIESLYEEGQDDYDIVHFYAYDLEEQEVIGYFKTN